MFTKVKIVLPIAAALGTISLAPATAQDPAASQQPGSRIQRQIAASVDANDRFSLAPDRTSPLTGIYFDPTPTSSKAYTYAASVRLHPSTSKRIWIGELSFPAFNGTPAVSVQIISSIGAMPLQVKSLKIVDNSEPFDPIETKIIVEAEPIFDGTPSGLYFANLVVTGVPVREPKQSGSAQLSN
jgi:hypothetical protein